jgi:hypothetical protein
VKPHSLARGYVLACLGIVAALHVLVVNYWPGFPSPNERSRAYQALAIVSRGRLSVDEEVKRLGGMEDLASSNGHLYPNKAPGATLLVVPAALVAHAFAPSDGAELVWTLFGGRLLASSLPFLLTVALLAGHTAGNSQRGAILAATALALATPALPASLLLFSHSLTAFLLLAAYVLLHGPNGKRAALAGLAIGWAACTEFSAVIPGVVLLIAASPRLRLRGLAACAIGGVLPAIGLAAYNQACFGAPFALSYGHETHPAFAAINQHGLLGVGLPALSGAAGLLLSPARGVLVWAPVIVSAGAGLRRVTRSELAALAGGPLALLIAMSGYPNWHGGWFPGPRYLLAMLPLVLILADRGAEALAGSRPWRIAIGAALLWGGALTWLSLASFPFPPEDYPLPAVTFALPLLRAGVLVPSWLPGPALAVALALLAAAAALVVLAVALPDRPLSERVVALAIAGTALAATLALPRPVSWQSRLEWAVVHDLYAGPPRRGALEALAPACETLAQRAQLSRWVAARDRAAAQRNSAVPGTEF